VPEKEVTTHLENAVGVRINGVYKPFPTDVEMVNAEPFIVEDM
jgi:hypothetical protein